MPNYNNGKIYKLTSQNTDMIYIGSTTQILRTRYRKHRDYIKNNTNNLSSANMFIWGDCEIQLIENYPCTNKKELLEREQYYIILNSDYCVNINNAVTNKKLSFLKYYQSSKYKKTKTQYKLSNVEKLRKIYRDDYQKNKVRNTIRNKKYTDYLKSMGGHPRHNNCLARIDPTLFS